MACLDAPARLGATSTVAQPRAKAGREFLLRPVVDYGMLEVARILHSFVDEIDGPKSEASEV